MLRTVWRDRRGATSGLQVITGCYVTGDVATRDKDGYIAVLGRYDDVLNVAGHRIGTARVESALVSHTGAVAEAAAIGVPDPMKGETSKVFVQVRADHVASEAPIAALIEPRAPGTRPDRDSIVVGICGCVPRPGSGKILRRFLKAKEGVDAGDVPRWKADRRKADHPPSPENFVDITPAREAVSAFRL